VIRLGPLRLHWSLLLGAPLFCAITPDPLLLLGYAAVLLAHVTGHALATAGTPLSVRGVLLHALGGELMGEGDVSPLRRSAIAAAGVLAQLALLLAALAFRHSLPPALADALIRRNAIVLLLNLIPLKPLDGAQAFRLPGRLGAARRMRPHDFPPSRKVRREIANLLEKIRDSGKVR
jgi:stage IV sporulation protein FB